MPSRHDYKDWSEGELFLLYLLTKSQVYRTPNNHLNSINLASTINELWNNDRCPGEVQYIFYHHKKGIRGRYHKRLEDI